MKIYWFEGSKNIIGKRVKEARQKLIPPLTQFDLSARLGVIGLSIDRVSISKIESGDRFVPDYEVVAIAKVLGVSINWLLTSEDSY